MDPKNKNTSLASSAFKEWSQSITVHGLQHIFRTSILFVRIMWTILSLASIGACIYVISLHVTDFLNYDVVTKIRAVEKDGLPFPTITVCNVNPFVTDTGIQFIQNILRANNLTDFEQTVLLNASSLYNDSFLFLNYNFIRLFGSISLKSLPDQVKKQLAVPLNKMIISCLFNAQPCHTNDWSWFFDSQYGNCYRFNSGKSNLKKSYQTGKYNGLMLEIFVGVPENSTSLSLSTGAHIYINDNPMLPLIGEGNDIASGFYTNLVLERISNIQKPYPYSECVNNLNSIDSFDSEYYRKVLSSNLEYRQMDCFYAYIQSEIYKKCSCDDAISNLILENNNPCNTLAEQLCALENFRLITASNYKSKINKLCPLECESISYRIVKSESKYPSVSYANSLMKTDKVKSLFKNRSNVSLNELRESLLALNVFYAHLKQTEITESENISIDGLIGSIGGTLGLFMGISLLSLFEFFELILRMCIE